eukprot:COSAG02_NODE_297_length_25355_cov_78.632998_8_plen_99_part_00
MIAAHEGDNYFQFNKHGIDLGVVPNKTYAGTPRVYAPALRTVISRHEKQFTLQVRSGSYVIRSECQVHATLLLTQCFMAWVAMVVSRRRYSLLCHRRL